MTSGVAPGRRSSEPLCLAYEAAKLVAPEKARDFLYRLRAATVWECRPTTKASEILCVVRACEIDERAFAECFEGPSARDALARDLAFRSRLGIWALPAFLVKGEAGAVLIRGVVNVESLEAAIARVL